VCYAFRNGKAGEAESIGVRGTVHQAFPRGVQSICNLERQVRSEQKDKFARTPKGTDAIERKLGEIPEQYSTPMIINRSQPKSSSWFLRKGFIPRATSAARTGSTKSIRCFP
jgi:hypothetical protein